MFFRVLGKLSIVPEFLKHFRNSSGKLRKIWLKNSTIFSKSHFWVPTVLFRVLHSFQIVLQITLNTFYSKIKIQKTMALQSFQKNFKISLSKCHSFLNFNFRTKCMWTYLKNYFRRIQNSKQNSLNLLTLWNFLGAVIFWILISQQTVFGFICRTIWEESRTLNKTLRTLKNEIFKKIVEILSSHIFRNLPNLFLKSVRISRTMLNLSRTYEKNLLFR